MLTIFATIQATEKALDAEGGQLGETNRQTCPTHSASLEVIQRSFGGLKRNQRNPIASAAATAGFVSAKDVIIEPSAPVIHNRVLNFPTDLRSTTGYN